MALVDADPGDLKPATLRDKLDAWRDDLLGRSGFQRWAAAFPLTRPFARRSARALFDLCAGFTYTQILTASVRLGVFDLLAASPRTAQEAAQELGLSDDAARRLLDAARALKLVGRRDGRYRLGELGAALRGDPAIAAMVRHHALLYEDLRDPVALLRGDVSETRLSQYWAYARREGDRGAIGDDRVADYSELMAASQSFLAEDVLDSVSLRGRGRLLDVGGGEGAFATAAARRWPDLDVTVFDLPAVAVRANRRFAEAGLAGRARAEGGDFFADSWPKGADVISLVRIIHDHDDDAAARILAAARQALSPGGLLLLAEPMSDTKGAEPIGDAYFGMYLLAMGSGRPRDPDTLKAMLRAAGFRQPRIRRTHQPLLTRVMIAQA